MANSRRIPRGFLIFLAIVIMAETVLTYVCTISETYEYQSVVMDVVSDIYKGAFSGAKICIIGGSVGAQAANELKVEKKTDIAPLAANKDIGMAGHYYTLKLYLERGHKPKTCCLILFPEAWDVMLPNGYSTRGFLRPLGSIENALDLVYGKNLDLALQMLYFGVLPSAHYKMSIRDSIKKRFPRIMSYFDPVNFNTKGEEKKPIDWNIKRKEAKKRVFAPSEISKAYFKKTVELCKAHNIKFLLLISAMPSSDISKIEIEGYNRYLEECLKNGMEFSYQKKPVFIYPDKWFSYDGRHLPPYDKKKLGLYAKGVLKLIRHFEDFGDL